MTPATNVLSELAEKQIENNILVAELESEIAVINAGIGSAITGAKVMIGTSGGGFDLMTESLSLAGIAETPLVIYLASRLALLLVLQLTLHKATWIWLAMLDTESFQEWF